MSDSDETLPPSDTERRTCYSPDLFDDDIANPENKISKKPAMQKRKSKVHELSDSGSEDERSDFLPKHSSASISSAAAKKKTFIKEFLNMSSDDDSSCSKHNRSAAKTDSLTDNRESEQVAENRKKIEALKRQTYEKNKKTSSPSNSDKRHYSDKPHKKNYSVPFQKEQNSVQDTKHSQPEVKKYLSSKPEVSKSDQMKFENDKKNSTSVSEMKHHNKQNLKVSSPNVDLKRKRSGSPVPQDLRKAVTEIMESEGIKSIQKTDKKACPYGLKCYRKNPSHFEEFSHPRDHSDSSPGPAKKAKLTSASPSSSKDTFNHGSVAEVAGGTSSLNAPYFSGRSPQNVTEKFQQAQPYSFFLTNVTGIKDQYNASYVMDIKDILSEEMGNLTASCQFNYMFDIKWLMKQYPQKFRSKPLMIVHGEKGPSMASLQAEAMGYDNIRFCQARLDMMYGTHHTKMMLLLYEEGMRVVIHTSNLIQNDWHQKTQGIWISPVFKRLDTPSKEKGDSATHFKRDLIDYLSAYRAYQLKDWIEHITKHDMSSARVVILGSVPGRHTDRQKSMWGHMKLRHSLQEHGPSSATVKAWPVIGQFSSIGSMGANKEGWLCGEWLQSMSATKSGAGPQANARLQLIFPSKDNVRLCLEGYPGGGSIPYSVNTAKKQTFLHDFFHVWKSEGRGRTRAMPHIKTYIRPTQDGTKTAWFAVTSANLSKAAWGAFEKKGAQLMIRSYEIGVLFLPKFFGGDDHFVVTSDPGQAVSAQKLLLPYDLPVAAYEKKDRPWMWDIPYMDLPDSHGNIWCPFSK